MRGYLNTSRIGTVAACCAVVACGLFFLTFPHGRATNATPFPELLSALPAGAPTLVYVDLAGLRASSFYQHRPDKGPITVPNQDYAAFVRSTGFDFEKDLDRVVVASWPPTPGTTQRKNVVIAEGRFDQAKIRDYAAKKGKLDHQHGHDVYVFSASDQTGPESLTFLDDRRIALVAGSTIAPLFAPNFNASSPDPVRERAARLDGATAFMITMVPPTPDPPVAGGAQGVPAQQFLALARSLRWITLAARAEGDNLRISLEGECDSSTDAQQLKSALELLRMFANAGLQDPKNTQSTPPAALAFMKTLLTSAELSQSEQNVRIRMELTPDVFKLSEPANGNNPASPKS